MAAHDLHGAGLVVVVDAVGLERDDGQRRPEVELHPSAVRRLGNIGQPRIGVVQVAVVDDVADGAITIRPRGSA
ncbi:MAG TPA: hypothetical protein RMH26_12370, partial [Polyangiaceae bacterium LLY-WYZ-15_(1-7)]|nr:hypothetical protein [Polyangiaceae bacterium LLY-WYZ-15_(1-7)]